MFNRLSSAKEKLRNILTQIPRKCEIVNYTKIRRLHCSSVCIHLDSNVCSYGMSKIVRHGNHILNINKN